MFGSGLDVPDRSGRPSGGAAPGRCAVAHHSVGVTGQHAKRFALIIGVDRTPGVWTHYVATAPTRWSPDRRGHAHWGPTHVAAA